MSSISDMEDGEVVEIDIGENDLRHKLKREHADVEDEDEDGLAIKPPPVPTKKRKHKHKNKEEKKKKHRKKRSKSQEKKTAEVQKEKVRSESKPERNRHVEHYDDYRHSKDDRRHFEDSRYHDRSNDSSGRSGQARVWREESNSRSDGRERSGYRPQDNRTRDFNERPGSDKSYHRKDHPRNLTTGNVDFHSRTSSQVSRVVESSGAVRRRVEIRGGGERKPALLVRRYDDEDIDRTGRKTNEGSGRYSSKPPQSSRPSDVPSRTDHAKYRGERRRQRDERHHTADRPHPRSHTTNSIPVVAPNLSNEEISAESSIGEEEDMERGLKEDSEHVEESPAQMGSELEQSESGSEHVDDDGDSNGSGGEQEGSESPGDEHSADGKSESDSEEDTPLDHARSKFDSPVQQHQSDVDSGEESSFEEEEDDGSGSESEEVEDASELSPEPEKPQLPYYLPALQGCRSVDEFQCLNRIDEGTFGIVFRAKDKKTGNVVALKRLKMEKEREGFPITSLREVCTLLKAHHVNIVRVQEIVVGSNMDQIYIVMDYVEHDLKSLMETMKQPFLVSEVKTLMIQLLRGIHHLHDNWILHRDLKTSNLLFSHKGILKIGDFGLAREYGSPLKPYTPIVVTLWYRSPELLLGCKEYSTYIDMWSVGCIFAELLTMKPLFPGKSEMMQLNLIFKELGTPSEKIWPGYNELPMVKKATFSNYPYNNLRKRFGTSLSDKGFKFLNRFLTYCPSKRITAQGALKHDWFNDTPKPVDPSMFPTWPAKSEQPRGKKVVLSPKAPEGGKEYNSLLKDEERLVTGFQLTAPKHGISKHGTGFNLKF